MKVLLALLFLLPFTSVYGQANHVPEKIKEVSALLADWKFMACEEKILECLSEFKIDTNELNYARLMDIWAQVLEKKGDYPAALARSEQAIQKYHLQKQPLEIARLYALQASMFTIISDFEKADSLLRVAYDIYDAKPAGPMILAQIQYYDGLLKIEQEQFTDADSILGQANNQVASIDTTVILYAKVLYSLGESAMEQGKYEQSEQYLSRSLRIFSEYHGEDHPASSYVWEHFGNLYLDLGKIKEAGEAYLRARKILEESVGIQNYVYARTLFNLGNYHNILNQFQEAEELYLLSHEMYSGLVKRSNNYGRLLTALGRVYIELGQPERGEPYFLEAKTVYQRNNNRIGLAMAANFLGIIYTKDGQLDQAESAFREGLAVLDTERKEHVPDRAQLSTSLARLYELQDKYEEAEKLYQSTQHLMREAYGEDHHQYGNFLNNYAYCLEALGRYSEALPLYLQAEKTSIASLGDRNLQVIYNRSNIARMYALTNSPDAALKYYRLACESEVDLIYNYYSTFDETTRLSFLKEAIPVFDEVFSYALNYKGEDSLIYRDLQNYSMTIKSLAIDFSINSRQLVVAAQDPELLKIYEEWMATRKLYGSYLVQSEKARQTVGINMDSLEDRIILLEKRLVRESDDMAEKLVSQPKVDFSDIVNTLDAEEAVIDLVRFWYAPPELATETFYYCALLTRKGDSYPKLIFLREEKELKKLLENYSWTEEDDFFKNRQLYQTLWQPLESYLEGIDIIHISPTGLLHKVAFGGISKGDHYLQQEYQFSYYGNIREMVETDTFSVQPEPVIAMIGGAAFELDSLSMEQAAQRIKSVDPGKSYSETLIPAAETGEFSASPRSSGSEEGSSEVIPFESLPGSELEIQSIGQAFAASNWQVQQFTGREALEEKIKAIGSGNSPKIVHIATHAYFFPAPPRDASPGMSLASRLQAAPHPLLRSGLALAGANYAWTTGRRIAGMEDGILTAYEVSNLDLSNTELVVLSACETGLGDIHNEEGVFGLQRAFKLAGVDELIISLWKVPDKQTLELMSAFYKYYLGSEDPADALHRAQLEMSENYRPFYWAGFITVR